MTLPPTPTAAPHPGIASRSHHRFWRPAILVLGTLISAAVAGVVHDMLSEEAANQREVARQSLAAGLQSHIDGRMGFARFMRGLYDSSDYVSADEFRRFAQIDRDLRDKQWWLSVAWAPRQAKLLSQRGSGPKLLGALLETDTFPLSYLEPQSDGDWDLNDTGANPDDRAAMTRAAATLKTATSAPRRAMINGHDATVVRAFTPVFRNQNTLPGALNGFLIETIAIDGLFDNFLGNRFADTQLSVRIYDGETQVYANGEAHQAGTPTKLVLGDREWRLEIDGEGEPVAAGFWLPALIFAVGIALTALLYLRLLRADTEYDRIAGEVGRATAELADANHRLIERSAKLQTAADDLRRSSQEAQLANAAKTMFLANMSHELRTPLNAVIGFSEMISSRALGENSPRYFDYARDIGSSGRYLLSLIEDLLDMSRIELNKLQLKDEIVSPNELASDVVKFVMMRARDKRVEINQVGLDALPRIQVDAKALRQSLINLLTNAVKFSNPGGTVEIRGGFEPGGDLAITVTDRGVGISTDDLAHVFEPFWKGEAYRSRNKEGTGLGLALTQRLVEAHGGSVTITSDEGVGTVATIRLPGSRVIRPKPQLSVVGGGESAA